MEVGEKRPEPDGMPHSGPGINVIAHEDDGMIERHAAWTVLRPGTRKTSTEQYRRDR